jgi:hypothetical protein
VGFVTLVAEGTIIMTAFGAGISEPYPGLKEYYLDMLALAIRAPGIVAVILSPLLIPAIILTLTLNTVSEQIKLRALFLSPVTLILPIVLWSAVGSIDQVRHPSFGLISGKPAWVHSPLIAVLGSCFWLPVFIVAGLTICYRAQRYVERLASDPPRCERCDYLLIGLPEPRCPECGEPFDAGERA